MNRGQSTKKRRENALYWNYHWLYMAYVVQGKSAYDIAQQFGCTENNILYWLNKHSIPRRTISETRQVKHWGLTGSKNGMYGATGDKNPNWKGGVTADRQAFYVSQEWKRLNQKVWARDKATCQNCKKICKKKGGKSWHIHHMISFQDEDYRSRLDNLVLFCRECHRWVHSKGNINGDWIIERECTEDSIGGRKRTYVRD